MGSSRQRVPSALRALARRTVAGAAKGSAGQRVLRFCANRDLVPEPTVFRPKTPIEVVNGAVSEMSPEERGFLYALVRGARPRRILEIGTAEGGSALVMATALEENAGEGHIWSIDPVPRISVEMSAYHGRVDFLVGTSPETVEDAAARAGGPFDLAMIDGIHIYRQARADLLAVLPHLAEGAYVLLHDAFHFGVSEAVRELVESDERIHDCGYPCNRPRPVGDRATHAGFRLLRVGAKAVDVVPLVAPMWAELGKPAPVLHSQVNHDFWYCSAIEPCDYCQQNGPDPLLTPAAN